MILSVSLWMFIFSRQSCIRSVFFVCLFFGICHTSFSPFVSCFMRCFILLFKPICKASNHNGQDRAQSAMLSLFCSDRIFLQYLLSYVEAFIGFPAAL